MAAYVQIQEFSSNNYLKCVLISFLWLFRSPLRQREQEERNTAGGLEQLRWG